jgi:hypothetical protein
MAQAEAEHILTLSQTRQAASWVLIEEAVRRQIKLIDTWRQRELETYPYRRW